jgi:Tol biopolymer transport system component
MRKRLHTIIIILILAVATLYGNAFGQKADDKSVSVFTEWSTPVNLGPVINTSSQDLAAVLAPDGLSLFFSSSRIGSRGSEDIWVSTRAAVDGEWRPPINLGPKVNSPYMDRLRSISPDGLVLLFQSDRQGGVGGNDIWAMSRPDAGDNLGWNAPVNLGTVINSNSNEVAANYLVGTNTKLFFSSMRTDMTNLGGSDIYLSEILPGGGFGQPVNVLELNSPFLDTCFWVRSDGLEIIFSSSRAGLNNNTESIDLWVSTRSSTVENWSPPTRLPFPINTDGFLDVNPSLSADGTVMHFTSTRPGGFGVQDIYVTTRQQLVSPE